MVVSENRLRSTKNADLFSVKHMTEYFTNILILLMIIIIIHIR